MWTSEDVLNPLCKSYDVYRAHEPGGSAAASLPDEHGPRPPATATVGQEGGSAGEWPSCMYGREECEWSVLEGTRLLVLGPMPHIREWQQVPDSLRLEHAGAHNWLQSVQKCVTPLSDEARALCHPSHAREIYRREGEPVSFTHRAPPYCLVDRHAVFPCDQRQMLLPSRQSNDDGPWPLYDNEVRIADPHVQAIWTNRIRDHAQNGLVLNHGDLRSTLRPIRSDSIRFCMTNPLHPTPTGRPVGATDRVREHWCITHDRRQVADDFKRASFLAAVENYITAGVLLEQCSPQGSASPSVDDGPAVTKRRAAMTLSSPKLPDRRLPLRLTGVPAAETTVPAHSPRSASRAA